MIINFLSPEFTVDIDTAYSSAHLSGQFINVTIDCTINQPHPSVDSPVKVEIVKGLEDVELLETESCSLEVTLSRAFVDGFWAKDGTRLKSKPSCRIGAQGKKHVLTLPRISLGDAGVFSFQSEGVETSARLVVRGRGCHSINTE